MNKPDEEFFDKENRRERYKRRRSHAPTGAMDDSPRPRRTTPYKRSQQDDWESELDEWFDEDI